jgi:hypothetical protein
MAKKRLRNHKQRAMNKRLASGKRPMSAERKKAQKVTSAIDRAATKAVLAKTREASAKKLVK